MRGGSGTGGGASEQMKRLVGRVSRFHLTDQLPTADTLLLIVNSVCHYYVNNSSQRRTKLFVCVRRRRNPR